MPPKESVAPLSTSKVPDPVPEPVTASVPPSTFTTPVLLKRMLMVVAPPDLLRVPALLTELDPPKFARFAVAEALKTPPARMFSVPLLKLMPAAVQLALPATSRIFEMEFDHYQKVPPHLAETIIAAAKAEEK